MIASSLGCRSFRFAHTYPESADTFVTPAEWPVASTSTATACLRSAVAGFDRLVAHLSVQQRATAVASCLISNRDQHIPYLINLRKPL